MTFSFYWLFSNRPSVQIIAVVFLFIPSVKSYGFCISFVVYLRLLELIRAVLVIVLQRWRVTVNCYRAKAIFLRINYLEANFISGTFTLTLVNIFKRLSVKYSYSIMRGPSWWMKRGAMSKKIFILHALLLCNFCHGEEKREWGKRGKRKLHARHISIIFRKILFIN